MFNFGQNPSPLNKDQMHPQDLRNLFIFFIIATFMYFAFDAFVLKPQTAAMKERTRVERKLADARSSGQNGADATQTEDTAQSRQEILQQDAAAGVERIDFENAEVKGSFSLRGARLDDLSLRRYFKTLDDKDFVSILNPRGAKNARSIEYGWIAQDGKTPVPNKNTRWSVDGNTKLSPAQPVNLFWDNGQGLRFGITLSLDEHYMFTITQNVSNQSGHEVTLYPYGLLAQRGVPEDYRWMWVSYEGPIGYIGKELKQIKYDDLRKEKKQNFTADKGWLGITEKYWLAALVPPQGQNVKYSYTYAGDEKDKANTGLYQSDFLGEAITLAPGGRNDTQSRLYAGAKRVLLLQDYDKKAGVTRLDLAVDFGWFWFFTYPFFYALHFIGQLVGNMGVAVILMTVLIRGAVFPLTNTSYKSFAKMKKVAPQVKELREKYADDKQQMQKELVEMYAREGVNPMSGCFPILLQIPIFFALYKTFFVSIELRHAPFFGWIQDLSAPDPTSVFNLFGLIPWDPPAILMIGAWPCAMLTMMWFQKKLNPPPQDPLQRDIQNYMPFLFAFLMSRFASGLVIYWTFSAFIGIIQQVIIMRSLGVPIHLFGETEEDKAMEAAVDKGPALHPLSEMVEEDVEEALFGKDDDEDAPQSISAPKKKKSKKKKK
ncbi:MAG: membrane protein insertase YidC [Alphaproteobacteria bacterium]|nr:membrane protein insertase YidC [Alphaproteobacteria bacterium]